MTDDLAAFLAATEALTDRCRTIPLLLNDPALRATLDGAADALDALVGMVRAVLALHRRFAVPGGFICSTCGYEEPWPCPTVAAVLGAIPPTPTAEETR